MARALKVYRTPIGFHDAYVAASSRKSALAAWGSDVDLFARGAAEEVTDAALMAAALARPGEVVRTLRGTAAEHLAALPADNPPARVAPATRRDAPRSPGPRPPRTEVDHAEAALAAAEKAQEEVRHRFDRRQAQLDDERRTADREQTRLTEQARAVLTAAEASYDAALRAWRQAS